MGHCPEFSVRGRDARNANEARHTNNKSGRRELYFTQNGRHNLCSFPGLWDGLLVALISWLSLGAHQLISGQL